MQNCPKCQKALPPRFSEPRAGAIPAPGNAHEFPLARMKLKDIGARLALVLAAGLSAQAHAWVNDGSRTTDRRYYLSDAKSVDELYEACLQLARPHNIHCVRGPDRTIDGDAMASADNPLERFQNATRKNRYKAGDAESLEVLRDMQLSGEAPSTGKWGSYAFLEISKEVYVPANSAPVVKATAIMFMTGARYWRDDRGGSTHESDR